VPTDRRTNALDRRLTTTDAVVVGLSAMIGAGVFAAFAPAAAAAGG
jgi:APA family basic amino acid/polyamine antiporter